MVESDWPKFNRIGHRIAGDRTGQIHSRGAGREYVHICIDDASRVAFSRIMKAEHGSVPWLRARSHSRRH